MKIATSKVSGTPKIRKFCNQKTNLKVKFLKVQKINLFPFIFTESHPHENRAQGQPSRCEGGK